MRWQCEYTPDCEPEGGSVSDNANTPQTASPKEAAACSVNGNGFDNGFLIQNCEFLSILCYFVDFCSKIVVFMCPLASGSVFHCCISGGVLKYVCFYLYSI
jgi:hypothetical protein